MIARDISFDDPIDNIAFDDILLNLAERKNNRGYLRFWESLKVFIVLGRISKKEEDININEALNDNIEIVRRSSGGGTVLQGKGCLNYSLILSKRMYPEIVNLKGSYTFILGKVIEALKIFNIEAEIFPISDIAIISNKKKISGNAQRRFKNFILHHGTVLYDFKLQLAEKYLKVPVNIPEYRKARSHIDFISNVKIDVNEFKERMKCLFNVERDEGNVKEEEKKLLSLYSPLKV